jgi:hypothetical protein
VSFPGEFAAILLTISSYLLFNIIGFLKNIDVVSKPQIAFKGKAQPDEKASPTRRVGAF